MIPFRRITHALAAMVTAASLALGAAAPGQADSRDAAKVIAGVAALAIIANQLERNRQPQPVWRNQGDQRVYYPGQPPGWGRYDPPPRHVWRDDRGRIHNPGRDRWRGDWRRSELPRQCLVRMRDGRLAYDARCLEYYGRR